MDKLISCLDRQFAELHRAHRELIGTISPALLYEQPPGGSSLFPILSCGEYVLRSAAAVEQTFGGITANLWDDPFEWTLPENVSTVARVIGYLEEVEATRAGPFASFAQDSDLCKEVWVPAGDTRSLIDLLVETLVKAADYQ